MIGDSPQVRKYLGDLLLEEERFSEVPDSADPTSVLGDEHDRADLLVARAIAFDRIPATGSAGWGAHGERTAARRH